MTDGSPCFMRINTAVMLIGVVNTTGRCPIVAQENT